MSAPDTPIYTFTGLELFPLVLTEANVRILDIAHSLARQCRYGGHVSCENFSIAEHSVLVSSLVPPEDSLWGLLHAGDKAYLPDLPPQIKCALPDYQLASHRLRAVVLRRFGLPPEEPASVREAEQRVAGVEIRSLFKNHEPVRTRVPDQRFCRAFEAVSFEPFVIPIIGLSPVVAERSFLARFRALTEGR
jgi:hypothetical protein